ncbi:MAG: hypothetical protein GYA17_16010 [Chloroflexi bacterium]|nr:hypothetical protein [Chloroflexota bacterium]
MIAFSPLVALRRHERYFQDYTQNMPRNPFQTPEGALPPQEVRFLDVHVEPWPDGRRVRVHVSLTPFQENPSLQASIVDPAGNSLASAHVIETAEDRFVFTMHLRGPDISGETVYTLHTQLYYSEGGIVDQNQVEFRTGQPSND